MQANPIEARRMFSYFLGQTTNAEFFYGVSKCDNSNNKPWFGHQQDHPTKTPPGSQQRH